MLPPTFDAGSTVYNFYNFIDKKNVHFNAPREEKFVSDADVVGCCEVVGSSHGFLALFHKRTHDLFLYNPVSGTTVELPSIHTLSLTDIWLGPVDMRVAKVVVSDDQSRAMVIFGLADRLAFCCPGRSTEWTPLGALFEPVDRYWRSKDSRVYSDIVYSKRDKIFTCVTDIDVVQWNLRLSKAGKQSNSVYDYLEFEPEEQNPTLWYDNIFYKNDEELRTRFENETYVVFAEHSNQLYVVYRYIMRRCVYVENSRSDGFPYRDWNDNLPYKTIGFSVYKVTHVGVRILRLRYMEQG